MLCPSLYSGEPSTIDTLRPTTIITIPVTATQDQVETVFSQDDVNLYHTYLYNQYSVGNEAIPKAGFYERLTSSDKTSAISDNKITSETISDSEAEFDFYHKILKKISPLTTILKKVPVYIYVLAGILLLLIIMEIVLLIKRKKRRKRKKRN